MTDLGAQVEPVFRQYCFGDTVKARLPSEYRGPGILILSHLDTVHPAGTLDNILPCRREGDRVYGPGTCDMKGGPFRPAVCCGKSALNGCDTAPAYRR